MIIIVIKVKDMINGEKQKIIIGQIDMKLRIIVKK
jgi:hypothetical protein